MSSSWLGRVSVAHDVLFREVCGEAVILDLKSEQYFGLDPVGTCMRQLVTSGRTLAEAQKALLEEFDVDESRLEADLEDFS